MLELERGSCWLRLHRLPDERLAAIRREFLRRNPGWEVKAMHVDPFTGLIRQANFFRRSEDIGPAAELSHAEYQRRRIEPLLRNADLIGLSTKEIDALAWKPGEFRGSTSTFLGSVAEATTKRLDPRFASMRELRGGWSVIVRFQRDGIVSGFSVTSTGPPLPICTKPRITAARARAARGIVDASAQPPTLEYFNSGFTVAADEIGDATLSVSMYMEGGPSTRATSITWRLVWAVSVRRGMWTFLVDAGSGEVTGLRKNFMT